MDKSLKSNAERRSSQIDHKETNKQPKVESQIRTRTTLHKAPLGCAALPLPSDSALHPPKGRPKVARGLELDGNISLRAFGIVAVLIVIIVV